MIWSGQVWHGPVRSALARWDQARDDRVGRAMVWHGKIRFGEGFISSISYGSVSTATVCFGTLWRALVRFAKLGYALLWCGNNKLACLFIYLGGQANCMLFDDAQSVDSVCYQMKLGDFPRALNRSKVNDLFNGAPPYSTKEVEDGGIKVNFNDLTATIKGHDARAQLYAAFNKPGNYFTMRTDMGVKHKRLERGMIVTKEINRLMKRSLEYYECYRSKLALDVLHGIGPGAWDGPDRWCPDPLGIEDVLVPSGTLLTLRNLDRFALYRSYSWPELDRLTRGPNIDPGWDTGFLKRIKEWFQTNAVELMGNNWPSVWSPDKLSEGVKEDSGWYMGDRLPTIDLFDFYFWSDEGDQPGWYRRVILDAWNTPTVAGGVYSMQHRSNDLFQHGGFLYTSNKRCVADKWSQIVSFQFADLSAVAPFRYHSIRSLGWLLYASCMWQNILRCRFNEHVFESLMQYFRVRSFDEYQRALKIELINRGFIDETVQFVPPQERWQINAQVVEAAFEQWDKLINRSSDSYAPRQPGDQTDTRKTAYQVQTEVNATAGLVSTAFEQAYRYQAVEYREITRRFLRKLSTDPDVNLFRANCLRQGVPENMLNDIEAWDIEPEKIMGSGNKTIELGIANWLMQHRNLYDPEPQRDILRQATLLVSDDVSFADRLVPENPVQVTDSVHDAQLAAGTLMQGLPVAIKTGMNHIEYVETLLQILDNIVKGMEKNGGMASPQQIIGFQNMAQNIAGHIQIIAQDENEGPRVKQYQTALTQVMNLVKAFAQRLQQQMEKQAQAQGGNGQMSPESQAKIQATLATAKAKIEMGKQSHAAKTAQRQIQFQRQMMQDQQRHQMEMQKEAQKSQLDVAATDLKTAAEIRRERVKAANEPKPKKSER